MLDDYLVVHKKILPSYFNKVLEAKTLIDKTKAQNISQIVKQCGISRSTYYKYKDYIFETSNISAGRKAVLDMMLKHEAGILSAVLSIISDAGGSILTITQSLPIGGKANLTLSVDVDNLKENIDNLLNSISKQQGVENPRIIAIE